MFHCYVIFPECTNCAPTNLCGLRRISAPFSSQANPFQTFIDGPSVCVHKPVDHGCSFIITTGYHHGLHTNESDLFVAGQPVQFPSGTCKGEAIQPLNDTAVPENPTTKLELIVWRCVVWIGHRPKRQEQGYSPRSSRTTWSARFLTPDERVRHVRHRDMACTDGG